MTRFFQPANENRDRAAASRTRRDVQDTLGKLIADPMLHSQTFRDRRKSKFKKLLEALEDAYQFAVSTGHSTLLEKVYESIERDIASQKQYGLLPQLPFGKELQDRLDQAARHLQTLRNQNTYSGPRGP